MVCLCCMYSVDTHVHSSYHLFPYPFISRVISPSPALATEPPAQLPPRQSTQTQTHQPQPQQPTPLIHHTMWLHIAVQVCVWEWMVVMFACIACVCHDVCIYFICVHWCCFLLHISCAHHNLDIMYIIMKILYTSPPYTHTHLLHTHTHTHTHTHPLLTPPNTPHPQAVYQMFWLLLLMYGLPEWFASYRSLDLCHFFIDGGLNGLAGETVCA